MPNFIPYIKHILHAVDEHSLQAPFIYSFYTDIIKGAGNKVQAPVEIEPLRKRLLKSHDYITVRDKGAGSRVNGSRRRKIKDITKHSGTGKKFSTFLYRLVKSYNFNHIVELGTSFGINTLYMASASPQSKVATFEGCAETADIAKSNFKALGYNNIQLIEGNINEKLPEYLLKEGPADLVYFDANHQYAPTLQYFNWCLENVKPQALFVFDDIHWSSDMEKAWKEIRNHPEVTLSIDLFDAGIVFFRKGLGKRHYVLEF